MSRALLAILVLATSLLQGCAGALVQHDWHATPIHPALPPHHIEIAESDLQRVCGSPGMRPYGCAIRILEARTCIIYTGPRPAAWLMEHERKHCAGWDHGPLPGQWDTGVAAAGPDHPGN